MGVDLTLAMGIPAFTDESLLGRHGFLAYTRIGMERESLLFDRIMELPSKPMPVPVKWYHDKGIKPETNDPNGKPLRFVLAKDLGTIADCHHDNYYWCNSRTNMGALTFIRMLPPESIVVLYWH